MQIGVACSLGTRQSDSHQIAHNAINEYSHTNETKSVHMYTLTSRGSEKCSSILKLHIDLNQ